MADVRKITVILRPMTLIGRLSHHLVIWGFLVGAVGLSRVWFGGAWIVDLMVLCSLILILIGIGRNSAGYDVAMTRSELRRWLEDGMPDDVQEWKRLRR